jgi:hypothetical protein
MAITGSLSMKWDVQDRRSSDLEQGVVGISREFSWTVDSGTGANQADRLFQDTRTLTTGANETIDLIAALTNLYGTVTFAKLKALGVYAATANTTNITVSRSAAGVAWISPATTGALAALKPGCGFLWWDSSAAGVPVGAGGTDEIVITNAAGASADYTIFILGTSV